MKVLIDKSYSNREGKSPGEKAQRAALRVGVSVPSTLSTAEPMLSPSQAAAEPVPPHPNKNKQDYLFF